jgi:hypothetical protein
MEKSTFISFRELSRIMKVKSILCASILILAVLIGGCTTTTQVSNAAAAETPGLIGNWTGTMTGYDYGEGYNDYSGYTMTLSVTEQKDRIFSGEVSFTDPNGTPIWEVTPFAGAIGHDGKTLTIIEDGGGYSSGSLIAPDEMEIIYANGNEPFSIAIDSLKKS